MKKSERQDQGEWFDPTGNPTGTQEREMIEKAKAKPELTFDSIGNKIRVGVDLSMLGNRDKVNLCRWLMEDMGILDEFSRRPNDTAIAQQILIDRWNTIWAGGKR